MTRISCYDTFSYAGMTKLLVLYSFAKVSQHVLDTGLRDCVIIAESAINTVMPAKAGIQNLLKILDSVSRFACTE